MEATYQDLVKAVAALPNELRACLVELMNAGVKFVAGDWGRCPMTTLTFAKKDGECNVAETLEKSKAQVSLIDEMNIGDDTAKELSRILSVPTTTVRGFASAWDNHVDTLSKLLTRTINKLSDDAYSPYPNEGVDANYIRLNLGNAIEALRAEARVQSVETAHNDLRAIIESAPPYVPPVQTFVARFEGRILVQATDERQAWDKAYAADITSGTFEIMSVENEEDASD